MKYITIILCLIGLSYGQTFGWDYGVPTWVKFGDNPTGTIDMKNDTLIVSDYIKGVSGIFSGYLSADSVEADHGLFGVNLSSPKFISPLATSYQYFASSATADSLVWISTQASGDDDMVLKFIGSDGVPHTMGYDDGLGVWLTTGQAKFSSAVNVVSLNLQGSSNFSRTATGLDIWDVSNVSINPGLSNNKTIYLGSSSQADTLVSYAVYNNFTGLVDADTLQMAAVYGFIRYISADYPATASDWQIIATDTSRVTLPALSVAFDSLTAATGYGLQLDIFAACEACTISCADSIWGNPEIVLTAGDNASLRAGKDWWILR